jgi:hypothetical protein
MLFPEVGYELRRKTYGQTLKKCLWWQFNLTTSWDGHSRHRFRRKAAIRRGYVGRRSMIYLGKLAIAMLGVLAYQNRDKIGDMIRRARERDPNNPQGGIVDQLSKGVSGTALGDILDRFRTAGAGAKVDSWVAPGRTNRSSHATWKRP